MAESRRYDRRIREEVDEPGVRAALAADVHVVVSAGGSAGTVRTSSARSAVHVQQGRSTRAAPASDQKEQP